VRPHRRGRHARTGDHLALRRAHRHPARHRARRPRLDVPVGLTGWPGAGAKCIRGAVPSSETVTVRGHHMTSDLSGRTATTAFEIRPSAHPRSLAERRQALTDLAFGTVFTDHMARATWTATDGWTGRRVEAYGPLSLDPAAAVLH